MPIHANKSTLTKVTWEEIKSIIQAVNLELFEIIEAINPTQNMPLYVVEYPYGSIMDDGLFYYPNKDGDLRRLNDPSVSKDLQEDMSYAKTHIPMGLAMNKVIENFAMTHHGVAPWDLYYPGQIFALGLYLNNKVSFAPMQALKMSSGVRSIYMLPNIGDGFYHKNIQKEFGLLSETPKTLTEHWNVFREISYKDEGQNVWKNKVLLFTNSWIENIKTHPDWYKLHIYLFQEYNNRTAFERNRKFYEIAFSKAQANRNLRPNPYLADTAKHLFSLMAGGRPGFNVADNDLHAPISFLQEAYLNFYKMPLYWPHIFIPNYFKFFSDNSYIYYSLQAPTSLEYSPKSRKISNTISDLRELKHVTTAFIKEIGAGDGMSGSLMERLLRSVDIKYFHNKEDPFKEIEHTSGLLAHDLKLQNESHKFCESGAFVRGCVFIRKLIN